MLGWQRSRAASALVKALEGEGVNRVLRLRREDVEDDARCWLRGDGWALTYD